jgi:hypothetical protein
MSIISNVFNFMSVFNTSNEVKDKNLLLKDQMEKILNIFESRVDSVENLEGRPIKYVNSGKDVFIIHCREVMTEHKFKMKLIDTGEKGEVILYYGGLGPLLQTQEKSKVFERHKIVKLNPQILDYLTRLVSGQACGLFLGDCEDSTFSVEIWA